MVKYPGLPLYPVRDLCDALYKRKSKPLNDEDLNNLGVKIHKLDLETGVPSDSGQQYCKPYSESEFKKHFAARQSDIRPRDLSFYNRPEYDSDDDDSIDILSEEDPLDCTQETRLLLERLLWTGPHLEDLSAYKHRDVGMSNLVDRWLRRSNSCDPEMWECYDFFEPRDGSIPYRACLLSNNVMVDDDTLRDTELFCASLLMFGMMFEQYSSTDGKSAHRVFPVLVYSLAGFQGRIIQTHYDNVAKHFVVRMTKHFPITNRLTEDAYLMMRWIMNEPTGDTTVDP